MLLKIILIAFAGVIATVALKQVKPELAVFAATSTGIIILFSILNEVSGIVSSFASLAGQVDSSTGGGIFSSVIKIIGMGYITEYSAGICDDYGSSSIAKKIQLGGKVSIFLIALPIVFQIVTVIKDFTS